MKSKIPGTPCPLCGEDCGSSAIKFKNHVFKNCDDEHQLLINIYEAGGVKVADLRQQVVVYADAFLALRDGGPNLAEEARQCIYEKILADKAAAKLQAKAERDAARQAERQAKIEADAAEYERIKSERALQQRVEERMFANLAPNDKPVELLNYFYKMVNRRCFNYAIEVKLVKGLYTKTGLSPDEIRDVLRYMAIMGYVDIKRVNYIVSDAMLFCEKERELTVDGTVPNLVKHFYELRGLKPNPSTFIKEVWSIESTMTDNKLTIDQAKSIVEKMARENGAALTWFPQRVARYASKTSVNTDACVNYTVDREVREAVENIIVGRIKLSDVGRGVYSAVVDQLTTAITTGNFDKRYNFSEFVYKTGAPVSQELYSFLVANDGRRDSWFSQALSHVADESKRVKIYEMQAKYVKWLEGLHVKFGVRCANAT